MSCSSDKLLKLWSVVEHTCLRTFEGHTGGVLRCSFLTAGTQVRRGTPLPRHAAAGASRQHAAPLYPSRRPDQHYQGLPDSCPCKLMCGECLVVTVNQKHA